MRRARAASFVPPAAAACCLTATVAGLLATLPSASLGNADSYAALARIADDEPKIDVWFVEGCNATYPIGAELHMRFRTNVSGFARVWRYPDHELFVQDWMRPEEIHEIVGPVTGPPGNWWIFGELLDTTATATCYYTTTAAATVTPTLVISATTQVPPPAPTATAWASAEPSAEPTATPSAEPTDWASPEPTPEPSAEPSPAPTSEPSASPSAEPSREPSSQSSETGFRLWLPAVRRGDVRRTPNPGGILLRR